MGWGRMWLLGNIGQQMDLDDQRSELDRLRWSLRARDRGQASAQKQLVELQQEVDELKLYLAATLRLLAAKGVATPDEVRAMIEAVDREDGAGDKRFSGPITPED